MAHRLTSTFTLAALLAFGVGTSAYAGPITFTFDATTTPVCAGLAGGANIVAIQAYMNCVLGGGSYVTVNPGAIATKGAAAGITGTTAAAGYTADGHAVGVTGQSLTLGNTENATSASSPLTPNATGDAYLINDSLTSISNDRVSLQFKNGFTIAANSQITFNYEIFPDNTCTALNTACGVSNANRPDFEFYINGVQAAGSPLLGNTPGGGTYTYSPAKTGGETAPQSLGVFSYNVGSTALVNPLLEFVDWPATIGVDNLSLTRQTQSVPEPVTFTLLAIGMAGVRTYRRRMTA